MSGDNKLPPVAVGSTNTSSSSPQAIKVEFTPTYIPAAGPVDDGDAVLKTEFFKAASGLIGDADRFFNGWNYFSDLVDGNHSAALRNGSLLLRKCRQLDSSV